MGASIIKIHRTRKLLDSKLDNDSSNSTSDLECLTTTNSCDSAISETEIANYKVLGLFLW